MFVYSLLGLYILSIVIDIPQKSKRLKHYYGSIFYTGLSLSSLFYMGIKGKGIDVVDILISYYNISYVFINKFFFYTSDMFKNYINGALIILLFTKKRLSFRS